MKQAKTKMPGKVKLGRKRSAVKDLAARKGGSTKDTHDTHELERISLIYRRID